MKMKNTFQVTSVVRYLLNLAFPSSALTFPMTSLQVANRVYITSQT